jgi:hypothetical protein
MVVQIFNAAQVWPAEREENEKIVKQVFSERLIILPTFEQPGHEVLCSARGKRLADSQKCSAVCRKC